MLKVRGPGRATSPHPPLPEGRCDEIATKGTDVTLSSNRPRAPSGQRAVRPEELSTGSFTWPGQLAGRAIFLPLPKAMAVEDTPQAAPCPPCHGRLAHAGIGGDFPTAIVFSVR